MRTVRINRDEFIAKVESNKAGHRKAFEEALVGYRDRVIHELERRLRHVRDGRAFDQYFRLPEPEDRTADYDRVLEMARMSVDEVVELSDDDFGQYVMDQWRWKDAFVESTAVYRKAARS